MQSTTKSSPETLALGAGATVAVLAHAEETGGTCSVILGELEPGLSGPPTHYHHHTNEVYYVLAGRLELRIGDTAVDLEPGESAVVAAGTLHSFRSSGETRLRFLNIYAPGGFERYLEEAAALIPADRPPDPAALAAVAARFDFQLDEHPTPKHNT